MSEQNDISRMNKLELLEKCKELSITKCSSKNKSQLLELINSKQEAEANNTYQPQNIIISNETNDTDTDSDISKYTFIEVCAGGGGLSTGLIKAGFTPILLNDNNKDCCKTLKHNQHDNRSHHWSHQSFVQNLKIHSLTIVRYHYTMKSV